MSKPLIPQDPQSERAVLGCILQPMDGENVADDVRQVLPDWRQFSDIRHQLIYHAMLCLLDAAEPVTVITVRAMLQRLPAGKGGAPVDCLEDAGGFALVAELSMEVESSGNAQHYARIVADISIKREALRLAERIKAEAINPATTGAELLDMVQHGAEVLGDGQVGTGQVVTLFQIVDPLIQRIKARNVGDPDGLPTGYHGIDVGGGMAPGDLIFIAARPSMGKTALAMNIAHQVSAREVPVGIFSLEMSEDSLATRTLSYLTGFSGMAIRNKAMSHQRLTDLYETAATTAGIPLHFDFTPGASLPQVRRNARRMVSRFGCGLLILDYLQLMTLPNAESHQLATAAASKGLKNLAKELKVPIIALSQLSRSCESRPDKRPMLSDLRDSGALEQDADVVMFVYRDHVYDKSAPEDGAEVLIRKRREGPTGEVMMRLDKSTGRFTEVADARDERTF